MKYLLNLLLLAAPQFLCAQVILSETFENSVTVFTAVGSGAGFVSGNSSAPVLPAGAPQASQGTYGYAVTNGTTTLTTGAINTSGYTNIEITLKVAAFSLTATAGLDQVDRVRVGISTTGGAIWTDVVTITGASTSNSYWAFAATGQASSVYPNQAIFNAASSGSNSAGYSSVLVTSVPSAADVRVRIALNNNANERWVIDNFSMTGLLTLPVKLVSFTGEKQNTVALLNWKIAEAEDGAMYEIQRSGDGKEFKTIYAAGGDNLVTVFSYTDPASGDAACYYRLRITDNRQQVTYSAIIRLAFNTDAFISFYPNPVEDAAVLTTGDRRFRGRQARLLDITGKAIRNYMLTGPQQLLNLSGIRPGIYFLQVPGGETVRVVKR